MKPEDTFITQIQKLIGAGQITQHQARVIMHNLVPGEQDVEEEVSLMQGSRQVCPECKVVAPVIITCSHANKIWVTPKWRAPKKTNDRAWKRIAEGDVLWDHSALEAKARRDAERSASAAELMRKKKLTRSAAMREARYNIKTR